VSEPFSIENGLLTANGKLKRDAIAARFAPEIEQLFQKKGA
jgi:long-subunit acyl-CoA synthetase (AMP-forming)